MESFRKDLSILESLPTFSSSAEDEYDILLEGRAVMCRSVPLFVAEGHTSNVLPGKICPCNYTADCMKIAQIQFHLQILY